MAFLAAISLRLPALQTPLPSDWLALWRPARGKAMGGYKYIDIDKDIDIEI